MSTVPDDLNSKDGELDISLNLVNDDGGLKPLLQGKTVLELSDNEKVVYMHVTSYYRHYIVLYGDKMLNYRTDTLGTTYIGTMDVPVISVTSIGNTLIVLAEDGLHYFLWKNDMYWTLGQRPSESDVKFGLQLDSDSSTGTVSEVNTKSFKDKVIVKGNYVPQSNVEYIEWDTEYGEETKIGTTVVNNKTMANNVFNSVMASVNTLVAKCNEDGKFCFPFLVRYAYRMYDGNHIMASAPVLMIPSTGSNPRILVNGVEDNSFSYGAVLFRSSLMVSISTDIARWSDIIRAIDVFVSQPTNLYAQNGHSMKLCNSYIPRRSYALAAMSKFGGYNGIFDGIGVTDYQYRKIMLFNEYERSATADVYDSYIQLPAKETEIVEDIKNTQNFYLLKSIGLDQISDYADMKRIELSGGYLANIVNKTALTDDFYSHEALYAKYAYVYNSRLNIANVARVPFGGVPGNWISCYTEKEHGNTAYSAARTYNARILINREGAEHVVSCNQITLGELSGYIFYPNPYAYRIIIQRNRYDSEPDYSTYPFERCSLDLKRNDMLNGALYFEGFDSGIVWEKTSEALPSVTDGLYKMANEVYTSVVNNPFLFLPKGVNAIGTGEIYGIRSASKALSEGQFGQFPLYVFATDGIWAMKVDTDNANMGYYETVTPVSRDVVSNPKSILQIDGAVVFPSSRGLMVLTGSKPECISLQLDNKRRDIYLPGLSELLGDYGFTDAQFLSYDFKTYILNACAAYDYVNQRIYVFNPEKTYSYVYSVRTKTWSMCASENMSSVVDYYPGSYVMTSDKRLISISDADTDADIKRQLLISRPFKSDESQVYKTLLSIIQLGIYRDTLRCVLYGSRNMIDWFAVGSSGGSEIRNIAGSGYKYFIVVVVCDMKTDERLDGAMYNYISREYNKLR